MAQNGRIIMNDKFKRMLKKVTAYFKELLTYLLGTTQENYKTSKNTLYSEA